MKYLAYWLPAIAAVVVAAFITHSAIVDTWHDWTTGWHLYQLQAIGATTAVALLVLGGYAYVVIVLIMRVRAAIARRQARRGETKA